MSRNATRLSNAKTGDAPTSSVPPEVDESDNGASLLIESPVDAGDKAAAGKAGALPRRHDFPDGGGSGGAEAFRRVHLERD